MKKSSMTKLDEYMNPEKFPLTSQKGLSVDKQKLIDNFNYNQLLEAEELGEELNERQKLIARELREKKKLLQELKNQSLLSERGIENNSE